MIEIKEIDVSEEDIQIGIEALMYEHFDETSSPESRDKLKLDWKKYIQIQEVGNLILLGAFSEGILVGYVCLILAEPLHYMKTIVAVSDTIFLAKEFRQSSAGIRLIKEAEEEAKNRGAFSVCWYAKENSSLEKIFRKKNYKVRDIIFTKELLWE